MSIAKKLLKNDGTIAISIDHNEIGYMISLLDDEFGITNRKNIIHIKRSSVSGAKVINPGVVNVRESLVIYSKDSSNWKPNKVFTAKDRDTRYSTFITNYDDRPEPRDYDSVLESFAKHKNIQNQSPSKRIGADYDIDLEQYYHNHTERVIRFAGLND